MAASGDLGAQAVIAFNIGLWFMAQDQGLRRVDICKTACKSDQLTGWNSVQN